MRVAHESVVQTMLASFRTAILAASYERLESRLSACRRLARVSSETSCRVSLTFGPTRTTLGTYLQAPRWAQGEGLGWGAGPGLGSGPGLGWGQARLGVRARARLGPGRGSGAARAPLAVAVEQPAHATTELQQPRDDLIDGGVARRADEHVLGRRVCARAAQLDVPVRLVGTCEGRRTWRRRGTAHHRESAHRCAQPRRLPRQGAAVGRRGRQPQGRPGQGVQRRHSRPRRSWG